MKPFVRSAYNYNGDLVSRETMNVVIQDDELYPPVTIQSAKDDADINVIVKRFGVTGQLPVGVRMPSYGDYSTISDFQTAMNTVREATENFMELPAAIRSRFANSPQAFLEFCSNVDNLPELRKMGLANPEVKEDTKNAAVLAVSKVEKGNGPRQSKAVKGRSVAAVERSGEGVDGDEVES